MTGRSESAIDDDCGEEIGNSLSKCKTINTSFINLKKNNLLNYYPKR
jgi:hypothetical protein